MSLSTILGFNTYSRAGFKWIICIQICPILVLNPLIDITKINRHVNTTQLHRHLCSLQ